MRTHRILVFLAFLGLAGGVQAQSVVGGRLAQNMAQFGVSLAITGNDVLVGEPANQMRPGTIYVYRKTGGNWREALKVVASDGRPGDFFGAAMATDGQVLVVGAPRQNENRGVVYVFQRSGNGWQETAKLTASDAEPGVGFGSLVALRGDLVVVGAPAATRATGAAYVFRRGAAGWTQVARLASSEAKEGFQFGAAAAFAGDALLIGEPRHEQGGVVRVFNADAGGNWTETGKLAPAGLTRPDRFGATLASHEQTLLIGAPGTSNNAGLVFQYRRDAAGQWQPHRRLAPFEGAGNDLFGIALSLEANQAWIGAPRTNAHGAAYAFARSPGDSVWAGVERITSTQADRNDAFAGNVTVRGNLAAVTLSSDDYGLGSVAIFERSNNQWREAAILRAPEERLASVAAKVECTDGKAAGFECHDYDLLSFLSVSDIGGARGTSLSGNWGWTDPETGREYALIGRSDGTSFVDVTNPEKPVYLGDLPRTAGANASSWREIKTYRNWALIVSDGSGPHGIQFFDLTRLRNVRGAPVKFQADHTYRDLASIHNIVVNEESGMAAAVGANGGGQTCGGGLHMIDIKDPKKPTFLGCFADRQTGRASTGYSHDAYCLTYRGPDADYQGREICLGSNETMLSIADVTDKKAPKAISRASYPNVGYSHQGWYDAEQRYFYMNDELDEVGGLAKNTRTIIWDLTDLDDPQVVGEFIGTTQASDHNLYIVGNLMYQSNYHAGLRVIDISDRLKPVEVGFFDTMPHGTNGPGFGGSWNNYPFFKSGNIMISSGSEGMFMVRRKAPKVVS